MKRILLSAVAVALIAGGAEAQDNHDHHDNSRAAPANSGHPAPTRPSGPQGGQGQRYTPRGGAGQRFTPQGGTYQPRGGAQTYRQSPGYAPRDTQTQQRGYTPGYQGRGYAPNHNGWNGSRPANGAYGQRGTYNRDRGVAINRDAFRSRDWWRGRRGFEGYEGRRYGYWYAPGWGYYRPDPRWYGYDWAIGVVVPYDLRGYYLSDPYDYGLPPAPYGTEWIFLGDQLVLMDLQSGEIIQIAGQY